MEYLQVNKRITKRPPEPKTIEMPAIARDVLVAKTLPDSVRPTLRMPAVRP